MREHHARAPSPHGIWRGDSAGPSTCVLLLALTLAASGRASQDNTELVNDIEALRAMELDELLELELPVTAATKEAVSAADAPAIVTVLPRATLQARGARSVGEALALVPGLYVVDNGLTHDVAVRGVHGGPDAWSRIVKVLVDGQPVTYQPTGGNLLGLELIPIEAIESIEVIRGPASALYGANAFLGVVNIVTRRPEGDARVALNGEAGLVNGNLSASAGAVASASMGGARPASLLLAVNGARVDRSGQRAPASSPDLARLGDDTASANDLSQPSSVFGHASYDAGRLGTWELRLVHQRLDAMAEFSEVSVLTHRTRVAIANTVLRGDFRQQFLADALSVRAFAALSYAETLPEQLLNLGSAAYDLELDRTALTTQAGLELAYAHERHSALLGVDLLSDAASGDTIYQVQRTASSTARGDRIVRDSARAVNDRSLGAYAQAIVYPLEALGVTAGVRVDQTSHWGAAVSPRAAVVWRALDQLNLKLMYGSAFVPPAYSQLYAVPLGIGSVRGNLDLEPQTAHTVETQVGYSLGRQISVALNGFWTLIDKRVEFVAQGSNLTAQNLTQSQTAGGEGVVDLRLDPFVGQVNLSLQWTSVSDPDPVPSWWRLVYDEQGPGGRLPPGAPVWMAHSVAGLHVPEYHLQATLLVHVVGERKASQANIRALGRAYMLPAYGTLDLTVRSLELRLLGSRLSEVSLHATNLLDTPIAEQGSLGIDRPAPGRALWLRLVQEL